MIGVSKFEMSHLEKNMVNGRSDLGDLPKCLENLTLQNAMCEINGDFKRISNVTLERYSKVIENNSTLMLKLNVDYEVKGTDAIKSTTFIMKTENNCNEAIKNVLNILKLFQREERMYQKIIPRFEQLYKEVGKEVKFAPKSFRFDRNVGLDYVLLENLRAESYKNANRHIGFDMKHMESVLAKLAEFHAVSACYVEHFGLFPEEYTGVYHAQNRDLLKQFNDSSTFLTHLKKWKGSEGYYEILRDCDEYLIDRLLADQKFYARDFNVLNHGDLWLNNIMFQYDAFGKIKGTLFVDFQVCKYGSPAIDLYYLILSSAATDIKLTHFDFMVRYYYDCLIANLKILQYHRPLPKLKNLHISLLKNGLVAFLVVSKVLPLVLLDVWENPKQTDDMQNESKIKSAMYTNNKYVQAMAEILPWLDNRGLLNWK